MRGKSIAAVLLATAIPAGDPALAEDSNRSPRTIILFGASWCAPCRVELRQLPTLARLSAPDHLEIAWIDRKPATGDAAYPNVKILSVRDAREKLERFGGDISGLPLTIILGSDMQVCSALREPLTASGVRRLQSSCL
jgi:thiol-disulfide isomerase/thioredoxin